MQEAGVGKAARAIGITTEAARRPPTVTGRQRTDFEVETLQN